MPPYSILMLIFAAAILLYAAVLGVTKDVGMLPLQVQVSLKKKNRKKYIVGLSRAIALAALAPALAGITAIWSGWGAGIVFVAALIICLWLGTKIVKDVN